MIPLFLNFNVLGAPFVDVDDDDDSPVFFTFKFLSVAVEEGAPGFFTTFLGVVVDEEDPDFFTFTIVGVGFEEVADLFTVTVFSLGTFLTFFVTLLLLVLLPPAANFVFGAADLVFKLLPVDGACFLTTFFLGSCFVLQAAAKASGFLRPVTDLLLGGILRSGRERLEVGGDGGDISKLRREGLISKLRVLGGPVKLLLLPSLMLPVCLDMEGLG
mmetsp:Transcript_17321/g.31234  ORF Transcript_17321/g.31234 Transcript_17321/m.31234 type:complete len:215 (+) Transcript_17321:1768-2412(+)